MRRVHCPSSAPVREPTTHERAKVVEPLLDAYDFKGMPKQLSVFEKKGGPDHCLIYWDFTLIIEIKNSSSAFYYKGRCISGKESFNYPMEIAFCDHELGELKVVERGDIKLIYKDGQHVGNISFRPDIISYFIRA